MAWEWRKYRLYYYEKQWLGGTCRSVYVGAAAREITRLGAQLDRIEREQRAMLRMDAAAERERWAAMAATPPALLALEEAARIAVADAYRAAGYHQHKREWRKKRRDRKDENESDSARAGATARPADRG